MVMHATLLPSTSARALQVRLTPPRSCVRGQCASLGPAGAAAAQSQSGADGPEGCFQKRSRAAPASAGPAGHFRFHASVARRCERPAREPQQPWAQGCAGARHGAAHPPRLLPQSHSSPCRPTPNRRTPPLLHPQFVAPANPARRPLAPLCRRCAPPRRARCGRRRGRRGWHCGGGWASSARPCCGSGPTRSSPPRPLLPSRTRAWRLWRRRGWVDTMKGLVGVGGGDGGLGAAFPDKGVAVEEARVGRCSKGGILGWVWPGSLCGPGACGRVGSVIARVAARCTVLRLGRNSAVPHWLGGK